MPMVNFLSFAAAFSTQKFTKLQEESRQQQKSKHDSILPDGWTD